MIRSLLILSLPALLFVASTRAFSADEDDVQTLAKTLGGADEAAAAAAVETIQARLASDPFNAIADLRRFWIRPLQVSKRFALVEALAIRAIRIGAHRTDDVEFFQDARVRAMLAGGKARVALSQARALFNVATLRGTEKALLLLSQCIHTVHAGDTALLLKLAREQKAGAVTRPADAPPSAAGVLASIPLDSADYESAIEQFTEDTETSALAKGNLILLSGRPLEARAVFEKLLPKLPGSLAVHEGIARAIRAEDGNVGRANGYILALPEEELSRTDRVQQRF